MLDVRTRVKSLCFTCLFRIFPLFWGLSQSGWEYGAEMDTICYTLGTLTGHLVDYIQVPTLSYGCGHHRKDKVLTEHAEQQRRDEKNRCCPASWFSHLNQMPPGMPVPSNREDALGRTQGTLEGLDIPAGRGVLQEEMGGADGGRAGCYWTEWTDGSIIFNSFFLMI